MKRRDFFLFSGGIGTALLAPRLSLAQNGAGYQNLLILIELKGGNDGLNTVVPYASPAYYNLRPRIAVKREAVLQLDQNAGLHPSLQPLMALWQNRELAIVQGLGYPQPNLSHFRSIEIWDTASKSDQYLHQGWLTRAFASRPTPAAYSADGVIIGSQELGPLAGGSRAIALSNTEQFLNNARLAMPANAQGNAALGHMLKVESDIVKAAEGLRPKQGRIELKTEFPKGGFGDVIKTAAQVVAGGEQTGQRVAVLRLSIGGFDTHQNQSGIHAELLKQLANGLTALRSAMLELNRWDSTVVMTYAEFGRRPKENLSGGTDHGTVAPHFVMGGRVKGGLLGAVSDPAQLDDSGNMAYAVDFRSVYATLLEKCWGLNSTAVLGAKFPTLDLLWT
ncbi:MAG: Twin-arginine translocation pathway signal sequence protein [Herminiimonas sp.]|nr:Twin-arginine translocation pathway signal sequence protein [Herminiimonas sp.]